jgi:hypothetical protein
MLKHVLTWRVSVPLPDKYFNVKWQNGAQRCHFYIKSSVLSIQVLLCLEIILAYCHWKLYCFHQEEGMVWWGEWCPLFLILWCFVPTDCLLESTMPMIPGGKVTILILDDLHLVSVAVLFKEVFPVIETRGPSTTVRLQTDQGELDYYMHPGCYILGTMDRTR